MANRFVTPRPEVCPHLPCEVVEGEGADISIGRCLKTVPEEFVAGDIFKYKKWVG